MPALPTPEETLKALKAQPGIDLTRQKKGTKIMVETDNHVFEITVRNPASGLVEVSSTLPLLRESTVCQPTRRLCLGCQRRPGRLDRPNASDVHPLS